MLQRQDDPVEIVGRIKWFDPGRGFGFLIDSDGGPDVLLHGNVLRNYGQSTIVEGTEVKVRAIVTTRGKQAVEVLSILHPSPTSGAQIAELAGPELAEVAALPFQPARVKWFDKSKGFGFANIFGLPGDVFLHIEVLRHSGFADLVVGEAIALKVIAGPRGPMAALLASWDYAALPPVAALPPEDAPARTETLTAEHA
ncbi:cold shock domain-containing protein [Paracoccus suum]|uniref:Cold shock domain-containing protein n=1 Tax=Paracoccus suum TaxID=2259340 RepID=A0A344PKE0_9RHOB|nr:cold shock domain-containing protein [Paracoccus suum]AXC49845.1 cold shock domain-containing protein [Paracoccus suum]